MRLRRWVERFGSVKISLLGLVACIPLSVALAAILDVLLKGEIVPKDLLISAIIPTLLCPPFIYIFAELSYHLSKVESELRQLSEKDSLTGLSNRRHLFEVGQLEFERAKRYDGRLAVLMIDLDYFKHVNDTHGHIVGDEVLRTLAASFQDVLRKVDLVARYGGEEFAFILPETGMQESLLLAERIRARVELIRFEVGQSMLTMTVSIGVAERHHQDAGIETLFVRADEALYRAKNAGRNRVEKAILE